MHLKDLLCHLLTESLTEMQIRPLCLTILAPQYMHLLVPHTVFLINQDELLQKLVIRHGAAACPVFWEYVLWGFANSNPIQLKLLISNCSNSH